MSVFSAVRAPVGIEAEQPQKEVNLTEYSYRKDQVVQVPAIYFDNIRTFAEKVLTEHTFTRIVDDGGSIIDLFNKKTEVSRDMIGMDALAALLGWEQLHTDNVKNGVAVHVSVLQEEYKKEQESHMTEGVIPDVNAKEEV